jgi:transposase
MPITTHSGCFGGVPRRGIYDNMRTAIDKIGRGKERHVNIRFLAMASHYLFEPSSAIRRLGGRKARSRRTFRMPAIGSGNRHRAFPRWKP